MNEHSSRSHSMLTLHLDSDQQDPDDENLYITKHGKLTFVDLAGNIKVILPMIIVFLSKWSSVFPYQLMWNPGFKH